MKQHLRVLLALLTNSLALGLLLLLYLDRRNPYMEFLTSVPSRIFMAALCLCALATAVLYIVDTRRK